VAARFLELLNMRRHPDKENNQGTAQYSLQIYRQALRQRRKCGTIPNFTN
jgi:hypothetical protein